MARPITFLSDYGHADGFDGVCRAVIARIAPDAAITDLSHGVDRHHVRQGALILARSLPFAAPGVHLAVVDPGVGTERLAVAIRTKDEDRLFVGPDNGLLTPAAERFGGVAEAVDIGASAFALDPISATFHGRDVFAPVAARLAAGAVLAEAGAPVDPAGLVELDLPRFEVGDGQIRCHVAYLDGFGNATLNIDGGDVANAFDPAAERFSVIAGQVEVTLPLSRTFADVDSGQALLLTGSSGMVVLAVNQGSAADRFSLGEDAEILLRLA